MSHCDYVMKTFRTDATHGRHIVHVVCKDLGLVVTYYSIVLARF